MIRGRDVIWQHDWILTLVYRYDKVSLCMLAPCMAAVNSELMAEWEATVKLLA